MKTFTELETLLMSINRKSYPAYKELKGNYIFPDFQLNIEHVQGDPFASPSRVSVYLKKVQADFPEAYYESKHKRIALQDYLIRKFANAVNQYAFQAKGSGKSGLIRVSRCGQEVLERSALGITNGELLVRFEVGFPANGRTINALELKKIFFEYLPSIVRKTLYYKNCKKDELKAVIELAEDQQFIREELKKRDLVAFVANDSILPRESGVSKRPMRKCIRFQSPETMEVEMDLPNHGMIRGMGISKGITLIVGGGYHGKSTLLKAIEQGIYNHIAGDGREYVITCEDAVKVRAEDGRSITHVNISPFINDLPNKKDTRDFSTEDASGSTSQAANVVEAVQAGSKLLLIDEDTCATNFMVRDQLMRKIVSGNKEPITPFTQQAREMYERLDVSVVMVAGSSGAYFYIADHIIQMDNYRVVDITKHVKNVIEKEEISEDKESRISVAELMHPSIKPRILKSEAVEKKHGQIKIKQFGNSGFSIGKTEVDLKYLEQLTDIEQTTTLGHCLKMLVVEMEKKPQNLDVLVDNLWKKIQLKGFSVLFEEKYLPVDLAQVRKIDIYMCVNRYRGLR
mgnify:FL=1